MSIPASMIVDITSTAVRGGSSNLEFNGMVFTQNALASMCDIFTSANDVGTQFGFDSPEYSFAQTYWAADERKTRSPSALYFARLLTDATAAWIRGYQVTATLAEFQAISDGALTATIDLNFDRALYWLMTGAQPTDTAKRILSYEGVLMKKHLLEGVKKGAFDMAAADTKFEAWKKEKIAKIQAKIARLANESESAYKARLEAEAKVKEAKAEIVAKKQAEIAAAKAEAEAAARAEVEAAATEAAAEAAPEAPAETPAAE